MGENKNSYFFLFTLHPSLYIPLHLYILLYILLDLYIPLPLFSLSFLTFLLINQTLFPASTCLAHPLAN